MCGKICKGVKIIAAHKPESLCAAILIRVMYINLIPSDRWITYVFGKSCISVGNLLILVAPFV